MRGAAFAAKHALVSGNRRHRRQRVHALRARVMRGISSIEKSVAPLADVLDHRQRAQRVGEADDNLSSLVVALEEDLRGW